MEGHFFAELKAGHKINFGTVSEINGFFPSEWWAVVLLHSGEINLADGDNIQRLNAGQLFSLPPSAKFKRMAGEVIMSIVCYTAEFAYSSLLLKSNRSYLDYIFNKSPIFIPLSPEDAARASQHYQFLADALAFRTPSIFRKDIFLLYYNLLLFTFSELASAHCATEITGRNRKEILFLKFLSLLQSNCRKEHSVRFYADSLCITVGYLGKAVREMGGRSAKHFIEMAVASEAYMLLGDQMLSIADIADELSFSGTSTFSTFFKKVAMASPSAYRENILNNKL